MLLGLQCRSLALRDIEAELVQECVRCSGGPLQHWEGWGKGVGVRRRGAARPAVPPKLAWAQIGRLSRQGLQVDCPSPRQASRIQQPLQF